VKIVCKTVRFVLALITVLLVMVILSLIISHNNVNLNAWMVVNNVLIQILVTGVLKDGI
jgi:hypothetical protein